MWSYYGSKTSLVDCYPRPMYGHIIEPFAGTAKYALKYFDKEVTLIDKYPVIIDIWNWLKLCSENDILKLPRKLNYGDKLSDITFDCEAQKNFYGFIIGCGSERPKQTANKRKTTIRPNHINFNLKKVADNLFKIKHWNFICDDYHNHNNIKGTYFIDPPYQFGGEWYVFNNKNLDYMNLGLWVKELQWQTIVCENMRANWLDFKPIKKSRGSLLSQTEAIWTNMPTHYDNLQQQLIL